MNLILLAPADFMDDRIAVLRGERCAHVLTILKAAPGKILRVGILEGQLGTARVTAIAADRASVSLEIMALTDDPPAPSPVTLILAMPRPLVFKRVLAHAITLGVKHLHIIGSARTEKSYFHTPLLEKTSLEKISMEALEQAVDTRLPVIDVHPTWHGFLKKEEGLLRASGLKWVAHPREPRAFRAFPSPWDKGRLGGVTPIDEYKNSADFSLKVTPPTPLLSQEGGVLRHALAIGPEGGFIEPEIRTLESLGFLPFSLGPRILKVEAAVCVALTQMNMLLNIK